MSENDLPDFLGGEPVSEAASAAEAPAAIEPAAEAALAEAPPAAAEAPAEGQPRGPDGKFAPVTPPAEAAPAVEAPAPAQPDHLAPVAALVDERLKRQRAEDERDAANLRATQLQQWRDQQEAQARAQPVKSREEDPEGWERRREAAFQQSLYDQNLRTSEALARVEHGADVVAEARKWGFDRCETDPFFNAKVAASPDPINFVVGEWKRERLLARIDPAQLDAFQQWQAAQAAAPAQGSPQAQSPPAAPPAAPAAPRQSLAAGPSAGRADVAEVGDVEDTYEQMFRRS